MTSPRLATPPGDSAEVVFDSVGLQMLDGDELTSALHMITEETRDGAAGGSDAHPPLTEAAIDAGEKLLAEERAENDQLRARLAQLEASRNTPAAEHAMNAGSQADGYRERWLLCCCSTRLVRHSSVAAGGQAV